MSRKIRVVQYGIGPIGARIVRLMLEKPSLQVVGAVLSRFTGAHADAVVSELTLRNQRPYLKNTGRAGDIIFLIRDPM